MRANALQYQRRKPLDHRPRRLLVLVLDSGNPSLVGHLPVIDRLPWLPRDSRQPYGDKVIPTTAQFVRTHGSFAHTCASSTKTPPKYFRPAQTPPNLLKSGGR